MKLGILCSGVALGVYVPAIVIEKQLAKQNIVCEVFVLENLFLAEKITQIAKNKKAFHENFKVALMGQKLAGDVIDFIDKTKLVQLFSLWESNMLVKFIAVSGFWLPILELYRTKIKDSINSSRATKKLADDKFSVDCLHMDSDFSPSWKKVTIDKNWGKSTWLFSYEKMALVYELSITDREPISYGNRLERFLIHGGGWGMGTYKTKIPKLSAAKIHLDIVVYNKEEFWEYTKTDTENRYFMVNPDWYPWEKNTEAKFEFPQFGEIKRKEKRLRKNQLPNDNESTIGDESVIDNETVIAKQLIKPDKLTNGKGSQGDSFDFIYQKGEYGYFNLMRQVKGVISKPGGSTLVDSLASGTPLIMLEPFGKHEEKNAKLWVYLGFGIYYDDWQAANFSRDVLAGLHKNILKARGNNKNYINNSLARWLA